MPKDERIVYGAQCAWWDSIDKVGTNGQGPFGNLPCCPHCKGLLFEVPNEKAWFDPVDAYAKTPGNANYRTFIEWLRGKCFTGGYPEAKAAFAKQVN